MKHWLRAVGALVWKDILIDMRRKEHFLSMLLFSVLTLLLFNFALGDDPKQFRQLVPGMIWVVFLMAGVLGLNKSFSQELEEGCINGLLLTPADRGALFAGKMLGTVLFLTLVQLLSIPLFLLFFDIQLQDSVLGLFGLVFAATFGFSALGTLLSAITATLKGKEVLLPILLFPLLVPLLISVVKITGYLFFSGPWDITYKWIKLLVGFDIIILVLSYLGFEYVLEE